jgi:hypothetical protein
MGKNYFDIKDILFMASIIAMSLTGCSGLGSSKRDFSAEDLLLTQEMVPENWMRTDVVPVSIAEFGFGNEELDRHVGFVRQNDMQDRVFANHFVFVFRNENRAENWYKDKIRSHFNDNSIAINGAWSDHPDLTYEPPSPEQYRIACAINNIAREQLVCKFMAQYEEFVVIFSTVIDSDTTSVAGFNELVEQIDGIMTDYLQED